MEMLKKEAALQATKYVKDGMVVGLGTGSTAYYMIEELGRRVKEEGLSIIGIPTSIRSKEQAESLGIDVRKIHEVEAIDITIDGADEFDDALNGVKGGGGAHLFEKVVAFQSKENIWIVDESKHVDTLGKFPLPIEVVPFAADLLFNRFEKEGKNPTWRMVDGERFTTDSGNQLIDLHLEIINNPYELAVTLDGLPGIVEHGLFLGVADRVIVAAKDGIKLFERSK